MNILHYTIGLPPVRHGGSVQYANDLMTEQVVQGHNVFALVCGDTLFRLGKSKVKYDGQKDGITVYSLTNPITPTLIYGVSDPVSQHRKINFSSESFDRLIKDNNIEIFHLHTFMGLHKDIVEYVKSLGVKIVYTSHDFHGICPHYNLINEKGKLCNKVSGNDCARCNRNEPSDIFLRIANSSLFHFLKSHGLKIKHKKNLSVSQNQRKEIAVDLPSEERIAEFQYLLDYYRDYFSLVDRFHFNSSQTREKFEYFLGSLEGEVIPVITKGIADKRRPLESHNKIILGFIGATDDYKGFPTLKQIISELYDEGIHNIAIKVYGTHNIGIDEDCPLIEYCGMYKYSDISEVLYHLDGTIVPSKWYETFSLVTLESLAHGRPTIVSDHVGAKDIVSQYNSKFIFSDKEELKALLKECISDKTILQDFNSSIMGTKWTFSIENHAKEILNLYNIN